MATITRHHLAATLAGFVWQIRNPMGNKMTFWTHLPDAMCLRKPEKFQPRE